MLSIYMPNTVLYASVASLLVVLLAAMAGFAFSRYRFPGRDFLMFAVVAITGVPLLTNMLALFQMEVTLRKTLPVFDDRVFSSPSISVSSCRSASGSPKASSTPSRVSWSRRH